MEDAVMRLALAPRLPGRLVAFPKAVFLHLRMHGMRQRGGKQRRQQFIAFIGTGIAARQPVQLLGPRVRTGYARARLGQADEGIAQAHGLLRVLMQGLERARVLRQQRGQQAGAVHLTLRNL